MKASCWLGTELLYFVYGDGEVDIHDCLPLASNVDSIAFNTSWDLDLHTHIDS